MADAPLVDLLLPKPLGRGMPTFLGGVLLTWDATTYQNTVSAGGVTYTDLAVLDPASLVIGPVLLARTDGAPVVLGPLVRYTPPTPVEV